MAGQPPGARSLPPGHYAPLAGIIAVIWSWRNGLSRTICLNWMAQDPRIGASAIGPEIRGQVEAANLRTGMIGDC
jgi:hypothetical protein